MYELTISNSKGQPLRRFDLGKAEEKHKRIIIGRADDCDIQISHAAISRHHCTIEPVEDDDQEWVVRDLGSTHGMMLDGHRVEEVAVKPGLALQIGPAVLRFELSSARIAAKLRAELGE